MSAAVRNLDVGVGGPWGSVTLRDGSVVALLPVAACDEVDVRAFLAGVSPDSLRRRFFGVPDVARTARSLVDGCGAADFGLVCRAAGGASEIVAHAGWYRIDSERAEAAFLVTDDWQGRGLGALLFSRLAQVACQCGIATLVADVLPGNRAMIAVFERCGYPVAVHWDAHGVEVRIELDSVAPASALGPASAAALARAA